MTVNAVVDLIRPKQGRIVYARHFYYVNFVHYGLTDYEYITIIRDPVKRFVSSYLYYHFSSKTHIQKMLKPAHKNESLLECISRRENGCAHNLLTKYFCGHQGYCRLGNKEALGQAKVNMREKFALVGLLEEMDLSLKILSQVLPGFFSQVYSVDDDLPMVNKNEHSMVLSQEEERAVVAANRADIELYSYARELLLSKKIIIVK